MLPPRHTFAVPLRAEGQRRATPRLEGNETEKVKPMRDKHTPGDWTFDHGFIVAPDPSGKHADIYIAEIVTQDSEGRLAPEDQHFPNGDLLAAAPALLAGGDAVVAAWEKGDLAAAVRKLAEALAAARGIA